MDAPTTLAELLEHHIRASGFTPERLARAAGVPKPTLHRWLSGTAAKPQHWGHLLRIAAALGLNRARTDRLLRTAGQPPLATLLARTDGDPDLALLARWAVEAPHNLPNPLTGLVGRDDAVLDLADLLSDAEVRLLTLTGPGGSGKTRLGVAVARTLLDTFPGGVWFVPLAPVADPALVLSAVAQTLGVREVAGEAPVERLVTRLRQRPALLVLDNFEQVLAAGPQLTALLDRAGGVKALVTSRLPLRVTGEHERPVPPLPIPPPGAARAAVARNPAARLFAARAAAVRPDFALTGATIPAVVELCARLDGLPLALELAAARVRRFTPAALLARFPSRLDLGADGPRDVAARQQTLRATIAWSVQLLAEDERRLFTRLGVFAGGWTAEAARAICRPGDDHLEVPRGLAALVEANLVVRLATGDGQGRLGMLETIREYAAEHLAASGQERALRQRHADYYLALAEAAEPYIPGLPQHAWLARMGEEQDNLRAALGWALGLPDASSAARLAWALAPFWYESGANREGLAWLRAVRSRAAALPARLRASVETGACLLAFGSGQFAEATALGERSAALWRDLGAAHELAVILLVQGILAYDRGDAGAARGYLEESLARWRVLGAVHGIARSLNELAFLLTMYGHFGEAEPYRREALAVAERHQHRPEIARAHTDRGLASLLQGAYAAAREQLHQALAEIAAWGDMPLRVPTLCYLGFATLFDSDPAAARPLFAEALRLWRQIGDSYGLSYCLLGFAAVAGRLGRWPRAARLFAAAGALQGASGAVIMPSPRALYEREVALLQANLDAAAFATAHAHGASMSLEQALDYALADEPHDA